MSSAPSLQLEAPVVVRSPNWLGDAIMSFPAVRNLRELIGPKARLAVAAPAKLADVWRACPWLTDVIELPRPKKVREVGQILKKEDFKTAILFPNSLRTAMETFVAGIGVTIAYPGHSRRWLISHLIDPSDFDPLRIHQKFHYIDLVAALGGSSNDSCPILNRPGPPEDNEESAGNQMLALCPGAEYGPAKRWPTESFAAVARKIQEAKKSRVVILGAEVDQPVAEALADQIPGAANLAGKTSLKELMQHLGVARLVLSNDSGAMHLASALGTPVAAIFGSTEPRLTGPIGSPDRTRVLRRHVACSPCFLRECPIDFRCMKELSVEEVTRACLELWEVGSSGNSPASKSPKTTPA